MCVNILYDQLCQNIDLPFKNENHSMLSTIKKTLTWENSIFKMFAYNSTTVFEFNQTSVNTNLLPTCIPYLKSSVRQQ